MLKSVSANLLMGIARNLGWLLGMYTGFGTVTKPEEAAFGSGSGKLGWYRGNSFAPDQLSGRRFFYLFITTEVTEITLEC